MASLFVPGPKGGVGPSYPAFNEGRERITESYSVVNGVLGGVLRKTETLWEYGPAIATGAPACNARVKEITSTLSDTSPNQVAKKVFGYDDTVSYNNQNNVKEYDFGNGVAGVLLREISTTFIKSSSYTNVGLLSLPEQIWVYNGGGTLLASTKYEYDNYTPTLPHWTLTARTSISGFDSSFHTNYLTRGNLTGTTRYLITNGVVPNCVNSSAQCVSTYAQYDVAGNIVKTIDALGYATDIDYTDRFGTPDDEARSNSAPTALGSQKTWAFATKVTNALGHTAYTQFDYYLGKPVNSEDANSVVSALYYDPLDPLDRLKQVIRAFNNTAAKNQTLFVYDDTARTITATSDQTGYGDNLLKSKTYYDGMGRTFESRRYEDATNYIAAKTEFDALGRAYRTSNPYRSGDPLLWTTTVFDSLGRVKSVTTPDGAKVTSDPTGNSVTVTDQAGKARKSVTDGLGRLVQVYEDPSDQNPSGLNYLTSYSYDTLDNLTSVTQGTQSRTFVYDSLKRLKSAMNPESGTICYGTVVGGQCQADGYDANGNLIYKTEARLVRATYAYDALNRNTSVTYTNDPVNTPGVARSYDGATNGKGLLWKSQTTGSGSSLTTIDSYDSIGRPHVQHQQFAPNGPQFKVERTYDRAGHVLTQTYPSGHSVSYTYDSGGRISNFSGNLGDGETRVYASSFKYDAASRLQQEQYGTLTALYHKLHYNSRGQLYDVRLSTHSLQDAELDGDRGALINYYSNQNFTPGYSGSDNNGNLTRSETYIPNAGFAQDNYQYDSLNRLTSIIEKANGANAVFAQGYHYDRYGNRTIDMQNGATWGTGINNVVYGVNPGNNQLTAPAGSEPLYYDPAGNLTKDPTSLNGGNATYIYDAENRLSGIHFGDGDGREQEEAPADIQYIYDADGRRVRRVTPDDTWQVYGMDGELLAEYYAGTAGSIVANLTNIFPQKEYGYRGGALLVTASKGDELRIDRFITNFYFAAFGRAPTGSELNSQRSGFIQAAQQGEPQVLTAARNLGLQLFDLENASGTYNQRQRTNTQFVTDLYFAYLQRAPDSSGLGFWVSLLEQTQQPWTRIQARTAFELSGEFAALVSTVYGINNDNDEISGRVARYVSNMYLAVPGGAGSQANDTTALEAAAAEGQSQTIQTARTIGISLFQPWLSGTQTNQVFVTGLFNAFLQREPSATEVNTWIATVQLQGRAQVLQSFANLSASQELAGGLYREILWLTSDQLGTPRMISTPSGSLAGIKRHDYLPFGEEIFAGTGGRTSAQGYSATDGVRQKFTQKERDIETGLDYFLARYYSSTQGRFTSPDPLYFQMMMAIDPQRFNLYGYARNNPLKFVDPSGEKVSLSGNQDWLRTNVLYEMAGGQENFDRYFQVTDGQVLLRDGVDLANAGAGVQLLGDLVNSTDNYLYHAGTNGSDAAGLFQGSFETNKKGESKLTSDGKKRTAKFNGTISNQENSEGTLVGTTGRGQGTLQPANLANGDPVFAVIAYNTGAVQEQTGISYRYLNLEAQKSGLGQRVRPVSLFIHESAENLVFAQQGGRFDYPRAHGAAVGREAFIRRELGITGGFAGGGTIKTNVPKQK